MEDKEAIAQLQALKDYITNDAPVVIGVLATNHFKENFNQGSFDGKKWASRKMKRTGSTNSQLPLSQSGDLKESIDYKVNGQNVTIYSDSVYAKIHNEGGKIAVTEKMKKYFWAMHYKYKNSGDLDIADGFKFCALAKEITITQRQFMGPSEELDKEIEEKLFRDMNKIVNNS